VVGREERETNWSIVEREKAGKSVCEGWRRF
jgi:hypothetical protein